MPATQETPAERLRLALALFEAGVTLMRQNLRRRMPQATPHEIEAALSAWLHERPSAPHGDAVGRSLPWPPRGE